jgi:hypothetical protein
MALADARKVGLCRCLRALGGTESNRGTATGDRKSPFALLWQRKSLISSVTSLPPIWFPQEKTYNPYYTLVCQRLCRSSHSYKVTLQFCLWDFLRDLGEHKVGGAEVLKHLSHDGSQNSFNVKSISSTRMKNIAKAYAWWIAKDGVSLAILKVF